MPPYEIDSTKAAALLAGVPVTYLVVDQLSFLDVSRRYAAPGAARRGRRVAAGLRHRATAARRIYRRAEVKVAPTVGSK